jgi:acetyl coenzyme A synthetase (ADP forming)-like protein
VHGIIEKFFDPSSVAIIGASRNPEKIGHMILKNLLEAGYKGKVFPVNPESPRILGIQTFRSVEAIPSSVDLAVVAIPSKIVPSVMEECAKKGIEAVIIVSGGFHEVDHGRRLDKAVLEIARKAKIRVIGPNCQGVNNPHSGLCATFAGFSRLRGHMAIITQSGSVGGAIQCWAERDGIGISKCVNLGNKIDVDEVDILRFLKNDTDTKVIGIYIEGLANGRAFMEAAAEVSKAKPIVVLKSGVTRAGSKATLSHTGSLTGRSEIFDAALKQADVIKANSLEEFYDIMKAFESLPLPEGPGVLIIESSGGVGALAADTCEKSGLRLPEPHKHAKNRLREVLSEFCTFSNPFDLTTESLNPEHFGLVIEENKDNDKINAFITIFGDPIVGAAEVIKRISTETDKPIVVTYLGGGDVEMIERDKMRAVGISVFPTPERAVVALQALVKYSESLRQSDTFWGTRRLLGNRSIDRMQWKRNFC